MLHHAGELIVVLAFGAEAGSFTIHPERSRLLFYCTKLNNLPSNKKKTGFWKNWLLAPQFYSSDVIPGHLLVQALSADTEMFRGAGSVSVMYLQGLFDKEGFHLLCPGFQGPFL